MFVLLKFNCFSPHCFPTLLQIVSQERAFISRFIIVLYSRDVLNSVSRPLIGQICSLSLLIGCQLPLSAPFLLIIV